MEPHYWTNREPNNHQQRAILLDPLEFMNQSVHLSLFKPRDIDNDVLQ